MSTRASSHSTDRAGAGVHLVGSVPLVDAETVFRTVSRRLGSRLRRAPDGETGPRTNWIEWQIPLLGADPALTVVPPDPDHYRPLPRVTFAPGRAASDVELPSLGYADAALSSYEIFRRLRDQGALPRSWRFQVCLPTPLATVALFVAPEAQPSFEPIYEQRMLAELDRIATAIPHGDLAVQWDTAVEFGVLEGLFPVWFDAEAGILERLARIGTAVPVDVELGYHLCYGDAEHRHFIEPKDAGQLVSIANAVIARLDRAVQWIHLPVTRGRMDDDYVAPLAGLRLGEATELYLGLVHLTDGLDGARSRIAAARGVLPSFGVATECGFGRRPAETVDPLLRLHLQVADELDLASRA
jgi:hypothetical protein